MSKGRKQSRAQLAPADPVEDVAIVLVDDEQPDPGDEHRLTDVERAADIPAIPRGAILLPEWLVEMVANAPEDGS